MHLHWTLSPQSLDDTELQLLGRTHSASDALRTLAEARRLFPGRVSVDLMLGLPTQRVGPWLRQLKKLLLHCDDHVSLYQLSLERGTTLFTQVQQGVLPAPDPELAAEMYQEGRAVLGQAGFRQYEVSNFARNVSPRAGDRECRVGKLEHDLGNVILWGEGSLLGALRPEEVGHSKQVPLT